MKSIIKTRINKKKLIKSVNNKIYINLKKIYIYIKII